MSGAFYGNGALLGMQLLACVVTIAYSCVATAIIMFLLRLLIGLRVSQEAELVGLDEAQHAEKWAAVATPARSNMLSVRGSQHTLRDARSMLGSRQNSKVSLGLRVARQPSVGAAPVGAAGTEQPSVINTGNHVIVVSDEVEGEEA